MSDSPSVYDVTTREGRAALTRHLSTRAYPAEVIPTVVFRVPSVLALLRYIEELEGRLGDTFESGGFG